MRPAVVRLPSPLQHQRQRRRNGSPSAARLRKRAVGALPRPHPTADHITPLQAPTVCSEHGGANPFHNFRSQMNQPPNDPRHKSRPAHTKTQQNAHIRTQNTTHFGDGGHTIDTPQKPARPKIEEMAHHEQHGYDHKTAARKESRDEKNLARTSTQSTNSTHHPPNPHAMSS